MKSENGTLSVANLQLNLRGTAVLHSLSTLATVPVSNAEVPLTTKITNPREISHVWFPIAARSILYEEL